MTLTFTGFNEKTERAMMVGNLGSVPLLFREVDGNIRLIQITESSNVSVTTISVEEDNYGPSILAICGLGTQVESYLYSLGRAQCVKHAAFLVGAANLVTTAINKKFPCN